MNAPTGSAQSGAADGLSGSSMSALRAVLRIGGFRRIWYATALSSLGDWLGLLATTALAASLADTYQGQNYALGLVLVVRLLPSILLGPLAGAFADRFDRRRTMVISDMLRFVLFVSIPVSMNFDITNHQKLTVLYVASFLVECVSLFWNPAKDASVPNLVGRPRLDAANQLGLITTYGLTPVGAAALFSGLDLLSERLSGRFDWFTTNQVGLSLYFNAATFVVAGAICWTIKAISGSHDRTEQTQKTVLSMIREGAEFVGTSKLLRGTIVGILGAFAAGGAVIGAGRTYVTSLGGGNAAYGVLFGAVFVGLGLGMAVAPRIARGMSRRRLFGVAIVVAGVCLVLAALAPQIWLSVIVVLGVGFGAGVAFLSGMTLLGTEVGDDIRGRVFAFVQALVRIVLILSLAAVPFIVGRVGQTSSLFGANVVVDGTRIVLGGGGLLAALAGIAAYRLMDDRGRMPVLLDLRSSLRRDEATRRRMQTGGVLIAFEGGEGAGKSTQIRALAETLRAAGHVVTTTFEPGATTTGQRLRAILLDADGQVDDRAEALLFAADRAHHVATVIRPALDRGEIVLTDRFVDSSLAYQGVGRSLTVDEVRRISRWATDGLTPDLTVVLDIPARAGLARVRQRGGADDRLEQESLAFHERVRQAYRGFAEAEPRRYLVVDAEQEQAAITGEIRDAVTTLLADRPPAAEVPAEAPSVDTSTDADPVSPPSGRVLS